MTPSRRLSRWQASGIHLLISVAIAAVALVLMLRVWYPPPLFIAEGGNDLLFIMIAVDVVIGPLITLIIFKAGKPRLRFDLTVIALLQAGALLYGSHVMFVARPVFIAFVLDQFEIVRANDLEPASIAQASDPGFRSLPVTGPVFVAIDMPKDMKVLREIISEAQKGGETVQHLPKYYVPYSKYKEQVIAQGRPIEDLLKREPGMADRMEKQIAETGHQAPDLKYLPLQTRRGWGAVLIEAKTGEVVKMLPPPNL